MNGPKMTGKAIANNKCAPFMSIKEMKNINGALISQVVNIVYVHLYYV